MIAGAAVTQDEADGASAGWAESPPGPWLAESREPCGPPAPARGDPGAALKGALRPYQQAGVAWLRLVCGLGLGACLADDMGLGKTIQVLALLCFRSATAPMQPGDRACSSRPLRCSRLGGIEKFAPSLKAAIVHPSTMKPEDLEQFSEGRAKNLDLVITSYGSLLRIESLKAIACCCFPASLTSHKGALTSVSLLALDIEEC